MLDTSGHIDKQLVFKRRGGKTFITGYPDMSKVKRSDKQKRVNDMMEAANRYARRIIYDDKQIMEAQARLDVTRNKLYTSLVREFFTIHKEDQDPLKAVGMTRNLERRKNNKHRKNQMRPWK